jgi:hypothetical protein
MLKVTSDAFERAKRGVAFERAKRRFEARD